MKTSVALCTYNGEKYIREQLESILSQTVSVNEIVVGDDGSTDDTLKIVNEVLSKGGVPFKVIDNPGPKGVRGNFYNAIKACSNEIVFTCDQDDVWKKDKVEKMLVPFKDNENALVVFSDATLVDGELKPINCNLWKTRNYKPLRDNEGMFGYLLRYRVVTGACMAVKREFAIYCGIAKGDWLHDAWFAINASAMGEVIAIPEELIYYRQHGNNTIGAKKLDSNQKVKGYLNYVKVMPDMWQGRLERVLSFKEFAKDKIQFDKLKRLERCVNFWKDLTRIKDVNRFKGLYIVIKNLFNGNYRRFYSGFRGAVRDCLAVLFIEKS